MRSVCLRGIGRGVETLKKVVSYLPKSLHAAICIVLHVGSGPSYLPDILTHAGELPASHPKDGEKLREGRIYVAPPDLHMLVRPGHIRIIPGPKENYYRPAINPLFRTAAGAYQDRVAGVALSGALEDGAIGLKAIKHQGGTTVVQKPREAIVPEMPKNAIRKDEVDYVLRLPEAFLIEASNR